MVASLLAMAVAVVATFEVVDPFAPAVHSWLFALCVFAAGAYLLFEALAAVARGRGDALSLTAFGGALLAGAVAYSSFLIGQPQRVPAVPGQTYRPPHGSGVAVVFPGVSAFARPAAVWPDRIVVEGPGLRREARAGDTVRAGAFVFKVADGPIACVDARSWSGSPVTITQPDGPAFLSPCLTFIGFDGDRPEDYFAVPALHRTVQTDYWAGLPSRGIDVPFLVIRIAEENGGSLFEGVAVSGRTLRKAGTVLNFAIGTYPVVTVSDAPPPLPYWAGIAMILAGAIASLARFTAGRK